MLFLFFFLGLVDLVLVLLSLLKSEFLFVFLIISDLLGFDLIDDFLFL
jgi:hypothetical protein